MPAACEKSTLTLMVFDDIFKVIFRYLENSYAYLDRYEDGREKGRKQDACSVRS